MIVQNTSAQDNSKFNKWLDEFKLKAIDQGISSNTVEGILGKAIFLPKVIQYDRKQPEFYEDTNTYISKRSNNKKVLASGGISKPSELKIKNKAQVLNEKPAVHLASYRSQKQAKRGWAQIKRAHKVVLGSLRHEISRVRLGKKGVYFRLKAGPFESLSNAKTACGKLKRRRQFCETSTMGRG